MSDEVCSSVKRRRQTNKEYRKMRRVCDMNDKRTETANEYYLKRNKRPRR